MARTPRRRPAIRARLESLESRTLLSGDTLGMYPLRNPSPADSLIVGFAHDQPSAESRAVLNSLGAYVARSWDSGSKWIALGQGVGRDAALAALKAVPDVLYAEADSFVKMTATPNDPYYPNQWGLHQTSGIDIGASQAWDLTTGSSSTIIADTDTGIDYTQPDLYLNVAINQGEIPPSIKANLTETDGDNIIDFHDLNSLDANGNVVKNAQGQPVNAAYVTDSNSNGHIDAADLLADPRWMNGRDNDGNGLVNDLVGWRITTNSSNVTTTSNNAQDDNGHGTRTAGIMGASSNNAVGIAGVNWHAHILPLKFLDSTGSGSDSDAVTMIDYAVAQGAKVINASWGDTQSDPALDAAIKYAGSHNVVFVAAAGNNGSNNDTTPFYPAAYHEPNELSVAAVDSTGTLASFSNFGPNTVDLAAPGVGIYSTARGGGFSAGNGTSFAAPYVTGIVSLLAAQHPEFGAEALVARIAATTKPLASLAGKTVTGGMANAYNALTAPLDVTGPRVTSATPTGVVGGAVSAVTLNFSKRLLTGSFTLSSIDSLTGPSGAITPTAVNKITATQYQVTFPTQSAGGSYSLTIGPNITDVYGNKMDQNQNGTNGEDPADRFTDAFTISTQSAPSQYDFGTSTSPVAVGYTQVVPATKYTSSQHFGWLSGSISAADRGNVGTDITRDFNYTNNAVFAVDEPNGTYNVTVTVGDLGTPTHDMQGIFLQGTQVDSITTAGGQVVTRTYSATITNGQLDLGLKDLGGSDPYVCIEGLTISATSADVTGPHVVSASPTGNVSGSISQVTVTFSEAILDGSFTLSSVDSLTGPNGAITPTAVNKINSTQYQVTFPAQSAVGTYSLTIGPNITDLSGNKMDQNQNGTNGEDPADRYTDTFTITAVPTQYDFGTSTSPVASGYTQVVPATKYTSSQHYGWLSGSISQADRGNVGNDMTRDFNYTNNAVFAVDVANGTHNVTVTVGDLGTPTHDMQGIFLQGTQVDSITTVGGQVVTKTYSVTITNGQLNLGLKDLGGSDAYVCIEGLTIS